MTDEQKYELTDQYHEFISNIYRYDNENTKHYDSVPGLLDAMRDVYKDSPSHRHFFLYNSIVKEINRVLRKLEKTNS
jgi:hypothetical protein